MAAKLNRRDLAAALLVPALGQGPAAPGGELDAAREQIPANAKLLAAYEVPMAAEPSFAFKA